MTQEVATETTVAMTKAARVVATEMITATRALAVRVEVMETTPTQEAEIIRAPAVEGMETTPTQTETTRAPPVEVEDMEIILAQEVEINRAPQVEVEDMEITPAQEAETISRVPQVEGKARLNKRESKPLRALLRVKDGRRPFLPFDFKTEVDVVWWIFTKNFIVLSSCIIIE
jgi:hypothetical protein